MSYTVTKSVLDNQITAHNYALQRIGADFHLCVLYYNGSAHLATEPHLNPHHVIQAKLCSGTKSQVSDAAYLWLHAFLAGHRFATGE